MWPFRRAQPAPEPVFRRETGGWATLPPVAPAIPAHPLTNPLEHFTAGLAAWRNPSFLAPLRHDVDPGAPAGVLHEVITSGAPAGGSPFVDLPVVSRRTAQPAARSPLAPQWTEAAVPPPVQRAVAVESPAAEPAQEVATVSWAAGPPPGEPVAVPPRSVVPPAAGVTSPVPPPTSSATGGTVPPVVSRSVAPPTAEAPSTVVPSAAARTARLGEPVAGQPAAHLVAPPAVPRLSLQDPLPGPAPDPGSAPVISRAVLGAPVVPATAGEPELAPGVAVGSPAAGLVAGLPVAGPAAGVSAPGPAAGVPAPGPASGAWASGTATGVPTLGLAPAPGPVPGPAVVGRAVLGAAVLGPAVPGPAVPGPAVPSPRALGPPASGLPVLVPPTGGTSRPAIQRMGLGAPLTMTADHPVPAAPGWSVSRSPWPDGMVTAIGHPGSWHPPGLHAPVPATRAESAKPEPRGRVESWNPIVARATTGFQDSLPVVGVQRAMEAAPADTGPEPAPAPAPAPEYAPPATPTAAPAAEAPPDPAALEPDQLLKVLYEPLLRKLKTELRLDRERLGAATDLRR